MMAIIMTGGKQYIVREGQELNVELLTADVGAKVELDTLLVTDEEGKSLTLGTPNVANKVTASVVEHGKADKVMVVKYKPKSRYRRHNGHRQPYTKLKIEKIA